MSDAGLRGRARPHDLGGRCREEIVHALPDGTARLEVIEQAGHFPWKDVPDQYWPVVIEFCQGVMRTP